MAKSSSVSTESGSGYNQHSELRGVNNKNFSKMKNKEKDKKCSPEEPSRWWWGSESNHLVRDSSKRYRRNAGA